MATTDRYAEFASPTLDTEPLAPGLILPPGYIDAIDPATGQIVAVRIQEQPLLGLTPGPQPQPEPEPLTAFEKAQQYAKTQPDPIPAAAPPPVTGVSPIVGQMVVLGGVGSLAMLAAGGAIYIACAGLHTAGPWLHDAGEFLQYAAIFIVAAVVAAVVAVRKLKAAMTTTTTGDGTVVNALIHRHTEVTIGKQTGGFWKGQIHNNVN
ncbi:hypothetical protein [Streptacidiphilus neutrinimicus]|uniref:hypothetical protein n=1 Tax=Streptacidiphilus neutrinimicus TaxID=105420 RepID=UPI0005A82B8C|nr:hypothetical protein [Streptacidiphilus neutrinimicus]